MFKAQFMNLSYWEYKSWFDRVDHTIIGSGITGLNCALRLKELYPDARIIVLDRGALPTGASTKNAGFACFGSISEVLDDLQHHSEQEMRNLVEKRWKGIQALRNLLGDEAIGFSMNGGHELFLLKDIDTYESCRKHLPELNELLAPVFGGAPFVENPNRYGFKGIREMMITHQYEGQLHTGNMMHALIEKARKAGVEILNGITVREFSEATDRVMVQTDDFEFSTGRLYVATNGFATQLLNEEVVPARSQVLITKPIPGLSINGTFHLDKGYLYFRNIDDRILLGGGRNLDLQGEKTMAFDQTDQIQAYLEKLLREVILPGVDFEVETRWSGIMGVGEKKSPIIKAVSDRVYCGARLGGMGIAIGTLVGRELAELTVA